MLYSLIIYSLLSLPACKNEQCNYFNCGCFAQSGDSIEIFNNTTQDILYVVDNAFNSEPLLLHKKALTKFKPSGNSVIVRQPVRNGCIYWLTRGKKYSVEKVVNGISRIFCANPNYEEDKELNFFPACMDSFEIFPPVFFSKRMLKFESLSFRDKSIENDYNKQIAFLNRYFQKYHLSDQFYQQCDYLFKIAKYARKTQLFEKAKNIQELKDSISGWREETYQYYKDSLLPYLKALTGRDGNFNFLENELISNIEIILLHDRYKEQKFNSDNLEFFQISQKIFYKAFPQAIADFALTDNMVSCINCGHHIPDSFWNEYKSLCGNEMYKSYAEKILLQTKVSVSYNDSPDFFLMDANENYFWFKKILQLHKGRYIYLDFWASWCVPCRYEIPFSKKLESELGPKGIDFISLSIDENKNSWENAVKQENLQNGKSFLIINPKGKFNEQYKVNEIPRYLIFDREGRLIDFNAPRPSEKNTRKKLLELSKQ